MTGGWHCSVPGLDYTTHCATCVCHTTAAGTGGSSASPTWGLISLCPSQDIEQGPLQPLLGTSASVKEVRHLWKTMVFPRPVGFY